MLTKVNMLHIMATETQNVIRESEVRYVKIHEAVKKALEEDALIVRTSAMGLESDIYSAIKPTNSYDTCILIVMRKGEPKRTCRWWNPTADDLMADDWTIIKE